VKVEVYSVERREWTAFHGRMKLGGTLREEEKNEKNRVMAYTGCQGQCISDPPALPVAGVTEGEQF
jgi:hypothetical protein